MFVAPHLRRLISALTGVVLLFASALVGLFLTLSVGLTVMAFSTEEEYRVVGTGDLATSPLGATAAQRPLSDVFSGEVLYWSPLISAWAQVYQVDPNLIATLIQIESCGDPTVSSPAGAQGLFQVMPFHFEAHEDMLDVDTNARRGMTYLVQGLSIAEGHAGLALAGYNGGHGVIARGWASWSAETRRYYYWGSRIYAEASAGYATSPTLDEWLAIGGAQLCSRARETQRRIEGENRVAQVAFNSN